MVEVKRLSGLLFAICWTVTAYAISRGGGDVELTVRRVVGEFYNLNKERIETNYRNLFPYHFSIDETGVDTDGRIHEDHNNESSMETIGEEYDSDLEQSIKGYFINTANFAASRQKSINKVSADELKRLLFLTEYQIYNLIEYREKSGLILSVKELSSIKGFNDYIAGFCAVLFSFPNEEADLYNLLYATGGGKAVYGNHSNYGMETQLRYSPQKYMRFRQKATFTFKSGANISAGFFCENDAGEGGRYFWRLWSGEAKRRAVNMAESEIAGELRHRIPLADFTSFNVSVDNVTLGRIGLKFIAGDYRAGFGYGVVLRLGLSFANYMQPMSFLSRGNRIMAYNGSDENDYFRGAALSVSVPRRNIYVSIFYSDKAVDARIKNGCYSSLLKDGKHDTPSLFETRKSLDETVVGTNVSKEWNRVNIGATAVVSGLGSPFTGKCENYNRYRIYKGTLCNVGLSWLCTFGSVMLFGEAGYCANVKEEQTADAAEISDNEKFAALCGAYLRMADNIELTLSLRYYGASYVAPYSGPYSTLSETCNQHGAFVSLLKPVLGGLKLGFFADYTHYPFPRYRVEGKSDSFKIMAGLENDTQSSGFNWNVRGVLSSTPLKTKLYIRCMGRYRFGSLSVTGRGEAGVKYGALQLGADYLSRRKTLKISVGAMSYNISDWGNRTYMYEPSLPGTYGGRLLYKKGFAWYLYLMTKPSKWSKLYLKCSVPGYIMFGTDIII